MVYFWKTEVFILVKSNLSMLFFFSFTDHVLGILAEKLPSKPRWQIFHPLFSYRSFVLLSFTYRFMIHFELVFIHGAKYGFKFSLYTWMSTCSSTIGWGEYSFPIGWLSTFVYTPICVGCFWTFCSTDLYNVLCQYHTTFIFVTLQYCLLLKRILLYR